MSFARATIAIAVLLSPLAGTASAEVSRRYPDGFNIVHETIVRSSASDTYKAFGVLPRWWDPAHTYTGDSANLSIALEPGACFCERRGSDGIEHGRVIAAWPHGSSHTVRIQGALGPLQGLTSDAIMMFEAVPQTDGSSMVRLTYTVRGHETTTWADPVDQVLGVQFGRLVNHLGGSLRPAPAPPTP
jgi:hypothetical protein